MPLVNEVGIHRLLTVGGEESRSAGRCERDVARGAWRQPSARCERQSQPGTELGRDATPHRIAEGASRVRADATTSLKAGTGSPVAPACTLRLHCAFFMNGQAVLLTLLIPETTQI